MPESTIHDIIETIVLSCLKRVQTKVLEAEKKAKPFPGLNGDKQLVTIQCTKTTITNITEEGIRILGSHSSKTIVPSTV